MVITGLFVGTNVAQHEQISPIDEYVYLDYTAQVFDVGILPQGSQTGDVARNYISCLGVSGYGKFNPEACNSGDYSNKDQYPYSGKSSADIYPPFYFWVAAASANSLKTVANLDFLTGARLSGFFWLSASALLAYFSLRKLKVSKIMSFSAGVILVTSLPAWWSNTFISTDATAMFAGSISFFGFLSFAQGKWKTWHLILLSVLLTLLKFQNIMAVGFLALMILLLPLTAKNVLDNFEIKQQKFKSVAFTAISILLSALTAQILFLLLRKSMAIGPIAQQGVQGKLTVGSLIAETTKFISGMTWGSSSSETLPSVAVVSAIITGWILIGGTVAASVSQNKFGMRVALGYAWIAVAMISAPLLGIAIQVMAGPYFSLPARYGLSLFPIGLIIAIMSFDKFKIWKIAISLFTIFAFLTSISGFIVQQ